MIDSHSLQIQDEFDSSRDNEFSNYSELIT